MHSTLVMAKTFLTIFSKDRQSLFFTLFFPIIFMVVFNFTSKEDQAPLQIGIVNNTTNPLSSDFIEALKKNPLFDISVGDEDELKEKIVAGDMVAAIVLPKNFKDSAGNTMELTLLADASQARQLASITPMLQQTLLGVERDLRKTKALFSLNVTDVQARSQRYIDFLVPGLLAMVIMQLSLAGSGYNIVEYRRKGILKRLFVTPILPRDFIGGLVLSRLFITLIQVSFLLAVAVFLLGVPIVGSLFSLFVVILLGAMIFLSLGFFMGSIAKTQQSIMLLGNLISLPQMFLSGIFFPIDSMPALMQPIASLLPLSFVVSALREIIVNGLSVFEQIPTMIGIIIWLAISLFLAIKLFVWKEVAA